MEAYVGKCKECGAIVAATVDNPDHLLDVARAVKEFIVDGLTVEHCQATDVQFEEHDWDCSQHERN